MTECKCHGCTNKRGKDCPKRELQKENDQLKETIALLRDEVAGLVEDIW